MRGDAKWNFDYEPVDPNDAGATYKYKDSSDNLIAMINNIDPAWLNY